MILEPEFLQKSAHKLEMSLYPAFEIISSISKMGLIENFGRLNTYLERNGKPSQVAVHSYAPFIFFL